METKNSEGPALGTERCGLKSFYKGVEGVHRGLRKKRRQNLTNWTVDREIWRTQKVNTVFLVLEKLNIINGTISKCHFLC